MEISLQELENFTVATDLENEIIHIGDFKARGETMWIVPVWTKDKENSDDYLIQEDVVNYTIKSLAWETFMLALNKSQGYWITMMFDTLSRKYEDWYHLMDGVSV